MTRPMILFPALLLTACAGEEGGEDSGGSMVQVEPPSLVIPTGDTDTDPAPAACGAADLCARSIEECGVVMGQDECVAWYDQAEDLGDCADIAAYEACNCDCIQEDTCDGYFACGQLCFLDFCEG